MPGRLPDDFDPPRKAVRTAVHRFGGCGLETAPLLHRGAGLALNRGWNQITGLGDSLGFGPCRRIARGGMAAAAGDQRDRARRQRSRPAGTSPSAPSDSPTHAVVLNSAVFQKTECREFGATGVFIRRVGPRDRSKIRNAGLERPRRVEQRGTPGAGRNRAERLHRARLRFRCLLR